ncbi:MAG: hypothetical protein Kow0098_10180 [Ignavibacteriaceae bacterium]
MGTNSFHMVIVQQRDDGTLKLIDREKEVIRLGSQEGNELNFISSEETVNAIRILRDFKRFADFYNAEFKAVATSAVREAANSREFVESIRKNTGIEIEVIDGIEEARLIYLGVQKALKLSSDEKILSVDIGGGSTEILLAKGNNIIFSDSIRIGAVRLSKKFFPSYILDEQSIINCRDFIEQQILLSERIDFNMEFDRVVGTSGTIQSLAGLITAHYKRKLPKKLNRFEVLKSDFDKILNKILAHRTFEERLKIPGIEPKRADILPAGLLILDTIFRLFNFRRLYISEYALREGIIVEMIQRLEDSGVVK